MKNLLKIKINNSGYVTAALLVSAAVATIVLYGLAFLVFNQYRLLNRQTHSAQALAIAEAGINYYRWHLAHSPTDYQDGTGGSGPYVHTYLDPQGGEMGSFSLNVTPPQSGSSIVTIESTGWTVELPTLKRTITVQYGKPSMAQYSFLHDANIWFGSGLTINGQAHSNGGIRNDAINNSLITSALATYTCGSETGCSPPETKNGVWGSGGDQGLWEFPAPLVDFNSISVDFANMRDSAQTEGLYLSPSGSWGYHLIFNNNGTVDVKKITNATYYWAYISSTGWDRMYQRITGENNVGTYQQSDLPIIFAEDYLWVDGIITSSTEIVAAKFPISTNSMDIWLNGNLTYQTTDGSISAGLIAQNDIIMIKNLPNDFVVHGALLAQGGSIYRPYYACCGYSNVVRNSFTLYGSVISAQKSYWNWGSPPVSGFNTRNISYDPNLRYSPPPYFPTTGEYEFISWTE